MFARFGGEEFIVLLPDTGIDEAMGIAERLRQYISEQKFASNGKIISITISAGVTCWQVAALEPDINILISQADQAMYNSKTNGRNQVMAHQVDMPSGVQSSRQ